MNDIQTQKPFTVNQKTNDRPKVDSTVSPLSGFIANSMNAGHNRPIAWKRVLAGEKHYHSNIKLNVKLLTPKTPTYQNLYYTVRAFWVPDSRIWEEAYEFKAQRGGETVTKVAKMPSALNKAIDISGSSNDSYKTNMTNTTAWRDSFISSYIPRVAEFKTSTMWDVGYTMPEYNILPLRGYVAIYNDFLRHKEYDEKIVEYNTTEVTSTEWNSYLPNQNQADYYYGRAKKDNSYYSDYTTEATGFYEDMPNGSSIVGNLLSMSQFLGKISEARQQAENSQKNTWEIIAEISGAPVLEEQRVKLIGQKTFKLNYAAITQSTYNTASDINEEFQVMGTQGAYSYTEVNLPIYMGQEFKEDGTIHLIATVSADTVYEKAYDRTAMNVRALEIYRPDMKEEKLDTLWVGEIDARYDENARYEVGYKRKYSELFKLPNVIAGDLTTDNYYQSINAESFDPDKQVITQKTFQFFEETANHYTMPNGTQIDKKLWKDYSDLMLNKNQAIMNDIKTMNNEEIYLEGQNQIFFMGTWEIAADLPVDEDIKNNYTKWGEI